MVSIAIESTPAAVQRAGVGRYCRELIRALVETSVGERYKLVVAADEPAIGRLLDGLPPGAWRQTARLPASARFMTGVWQRLHLPLPVEWLVGSFDVYHGTDFVLPPTREPAIVTIHDLSFVRHPEFAHPDLVRYLNSAVPRAIGRADAVITVSASVAAEVADVFPFARSRIFAIPNGVRLTGEPVSPGSGTDRPRILVTGTIEPRKGHMVLLDAMDEVWHRYPETELAVAGRLGWRAGGISRRLLTMEATHNVVWCRDASDDDLEGLYASSTVFAYPSWYEGFGLPVLEAMARGIPVVASDVPAIREATDGQAMLLPPGDAEALAAGILRLLSDEALRRRLAASGMEQARSRTWQDTARRTRRVYLDVASEGRR